MGHLGSDNTCTLTVIIIGIFMYVKMSAPETICGKHVKIIIKQFSHL